MNSVLYEKFAAVFDSIFQQLDRIEHTLGMNREGYKKPVTSESEQAILR